MKNKMIIEKNEDFLAKITKVIRSFINLSSLRLHWPYYFFR